MAWLQSFALLFFLQIGKTDFIELSITRPLHFPPLSHKPLFHFCGTRGKMNTGKKRFNLTGRNAVAGTREVSKGGLGKPAFGTRSCSQGLVCYTFCSARRAKG